MDTCLMNFECGEVYLFSIDDPACPPENSLWGMFGHISDTGSVWLEAATSDLICFRVGYELPPHFKFCRLASRGELRDFAFNMNV